MIYKEKEKKNLAGTSALVKPHLARITRRGNIRVPQIGQHSCHSLPSPWFSGARLRVPSAIWRSRLCSSHGSGRRNTALLHVRQEGTPEGGSAGSWLFGPHLKPLIAFGVRGGPGRDSLEPTSQKKLLEEVQRGAVPPKGGLREAAEQGHGHQVARSGHTSINLKKLHAQALGGQGRKNRFESRQGNIERPCGRRGKMKGMEREEDRKTE